MGAAPFGDGSAYVANTACWWSVGGLSESTAAISGVCTPHTFEQGLLLREQQSPARAGLSRLALLPWPGSQERRPTLSDRPSDQPLIFRAALEVRANINGPG